MASRLGQIASLARLRPFDTQTELGRSRERYRRVFLTTGATVAARSLQALFSLMTVPIALHHYGAERYGLWLAISSCLTVLVFVDQGLGAGLVQNVAMAVGRGDERAAREWITAAFVIVGGFGLATVATLGTFYSFVDWAHVFGVETEGAAGEAGPAMIVLTVGFTLSIIAGLAQRVYQGKQAGFVNNAWQVAGSVTALGGVLLITRFGLGVPWLVAVMVGGPAVASAASAVLLFGFRQPGLRPSWRSVSRARVRSLLRTSSLFLGMQLAIAATLAADNLIVARALGAATVPSYAVPARLFYFVQMLVALVPQALWPAYSEALARGEVGWAQRAYWRTTWLVLVAAGAASALLYLAGPSILRIWVGTTVTASPGLLGAMGASLVALSLGLSVGALLNAMHGLRVQLVLNVLVFVAATVGKWTAIRVWGLPGIPVVMAIAYSGIFLIPASVFAAAELRSKARNAQRSTT